MKLLALLALLVSPLAAQDSVKVETRVRQVQVPVTDSIFRYYYTTTKPDTVKPPVPVDTTKPTTPPPANAMYFNSSEKACTSTALLCDDFEDGDWYAINCDKANNSPGLIQTDGWCGTIYADPITPAKAAVCGNAGYRSNCAATSGVQDGSQGGRNFADHSLAKPVKEAYIRFYTKPLAGYQFGAEKVLAVNKDPAGWGGIYWGNLHINCGAGGTSSTGTLMWQPVKPAPDGCKSIITMQSGHWYYIELHMNVATGVLQVYADDCGTGQGTGCTGTPTLRLNLTGWKYPSTTNSIVATWFEGWAGPGSVGTRLLDQIVVSPTFVGFAK